jgi:hypothetical protein
MIALGYGFNVAAWHFAGVNHLFVLSLNPRTTLSYVKVLRTSFMLVTIYFIFASIAVMQVRRVCRISIFRK